MDPAEKLRLLFAKYLDRTCTPEEVTELISLLQRADAEHVLSRPMEELWKSLHLRTDNASDHTIDWEKMYEVIQYTELYVPEPAPKLPELIPRFRRWHYTSAAMLLLMVLSSIYIVTHHTKPDQTAQYQHVSHPRLENNKQVIHLSDGTTVILNTNSTLESPPSFAGPTRDVYLKGEAYFEVSHRSGQPFLVHTGKVTTRVLGTAFDVRAYPMDDSIKVTVTQGKVQVLQNKSQTEWSSIGLLTANQQISFCKSTNAFAENKKVDVIPVTAWKPREILFDNVTMQEAAIRLEQEFHVQIDISEPALKAFRLTATFYQDDALSEILTVICTVSNSSFTTEDKKIIIHGK